VWDEVERVLAQHSMSAKMQIVRTQDENGTKLVGLLIPNNCAQTLSNAIRLSAERLKKEEEIKQEVELAEYQ